VKNIIAHISCSENLNCHNAEYVVYRRGKVVRLKAVTMEKMWTVLAVLVMLTVRLTESREKSLCRLHCLTGFYQNQSGRISL